MRKYHLIVIGIAFLMNATALYFGVRIYNANANHLITELNALDNIYTDDIQRVPLLSYQAALWTLPMLIAMLAFELVIVRGVRHQQVKNIALGLTLAVLVIFVIDICMLNQPEGYDFSQWGMIWIGMGLFLMVGNGLSFILGGNETRKE